MMERSILEIADRGNFGGAWRPLGGITTDFSLQR
jgi:hypothetical protein